jgi:hypothetical protein
MKFKSNKPFSTKTWMLTKRSKSKMQAVDMKFFKNTKREK